MNGTFEFIRWMAALRRWAPGQKNSRTELNRISVKIRERWSYIHRRKKPLPPNWTALIPTKYRKNNKKREIKTSGKTVKYSLNNIKPFHNRIHFNTMLLDTVVWRSGDKKRTYQPRCWTMDVSHRWSDLFKLEKPHNSTSQVVTFKALCALFQASKLSLSMKSIWNKRKHWILLEQTEKYKYTTHQQIANFSRNKSS